MHFLARHWTAVRGEAWAGDTVAEDLFPFISAPRFTLRKFARSPSLWFGFTREWPEFDVPLLREPDAAEPQAAAWSPFEWSFLWGSDEFDETPKLVGVAPSELASMLAADLGERKYILTGDLTASLFADDCNFVDPNNAVRGLSRYRKALSFLFEPEASRLDEVDVRVVAAADGGATTIQATYVASGELKLPWKPCISPWAGNITYTLDLQTGLVAAQTDVWNITRLDAIRQSFTPGPSSK